MSIFDASMKYQRGRRAAHRPRGQGVRLGLVARLGGEGAAAARRARGDRRELRAHPPLEPGRHGRPAAAVRAGESAASLGLTGDETFDIVGLARAAGQREGGADGQREGDAQRRETKFTFDAIVRIDTPNEVVYYRHGGILQYVLRQLCK